MPRLPIGVSASEAWKALAFGLLGAAAFPPVGLWPLSLVSIVLFLQELRNRNVAEARVFGVLYGLVYGLGTMYWFFNLFGFLAISLIALMAGYYGLFATLVSTTRELRPLGRAALVALFAVGIEWFRGDAWYLRFPWYTSPHALASAPICIAPTRWIGTYGFSYLIWFVAALGAVADRRYWLLFASIPAFALLLPTDEPPDRRALIVQSEGNQDIEDILRKVNPEAVDLAVLPEYAYFVSPKAALASRSGPRALALKMRSPVVFGAVEGEYGQPKFDNVAAVIDADGILLGTFPKQHPVPLFRDGVPGSRRPVFSLEQGTLGVAICYDFDAPEIASSLVRAGATVLVAPTFDALSWGRIQHLNHELLLRLRAVECDRWIIRAASSGRSETISPRGVPSNEGIDIGDVGSVVACFAHRDTFALGGRLAFLGPLAAGGTLIFVLFRLVRSLPGGIRRFRKAPREVADGTTTLV